MIVYRELKSLEADLGFSLGTLFALSNNLRNHYKTVEIKKRDGGVRVLSVPDEILKSVQRKIASVILSRERVSKYAKAYVYGSSVQKNASPHVGKQKLLKLDILHFFDSIYYTSIKEKVFCKERYSQEARVLLSLLCYYKDRLPQGAPTSPIISNIVMRSFDDRVGEWCEKRNITYTRYCDDMTFSGDFDHGEVIEFVERLLSENGFLLNRKKTVVAKNSQRQTVTGVVVNEKLSVSAEYRRRLRQEVYYCKRFGIEQQAKKAGAVSTESYLRSLLGRVCFVLTTNRDSREFLEYKQELCNLLRKV